MYACCRTGTKSSRESSFRTGAKRSANACASAGSTGDCFGISVDTRSLWFTKSTKKPAAMPSPMMFSTSSAPSVARTCTHHGARVNHRKRLPAYDCRRFPGQFRAEAVERVGLLLDQFVRLLLERRQVRLRDVVHVVAADVELGLEAVVARIARLALLAEDRHLVVDRVADAVEHDV